MPTKNLTPQISYQLPVGEVADFKKNALKRAAQVAEYVTNRAPNPLPRLAPVPYETEHARKIAQRLLSKRDRAILMGAEAKRAHEKRASDLEINWNRAQFDALERAKERLEGDAKLKDLDDDQKKKFWEAGTWEDALAALKAKPEAQKTLRADRNMALTTLLADHPEFVYAINPKMLREIKALPEKEASPPNPPAFVPMTPEEMGREAIQRNMRGQSFQGAIKALQPEAINKTYREIEKEQEEKKRAAERNTGVAGFVPLTPHQIKEAALRRYHQIPTGGALTDWDVPEHLLAPQIEQVKKLEEERKKAFEREEAQARERTIRGEVGPTMAAAFEHLVRPRIPAQGVNPQLLNVKEEPQLNEFLVNLAQDPTLREEAYRFAHFPTSAGMADLMGRLPMAQQGELALKYPRVLDYLAAHDVNGSHARLANVISKMEPRQAAQIVATAPWAADEKLAERILAPHREALHLNKRGFEWTPDLEDEEGREPEEGYQYGTYGQRVFGDHNNEFFPTREEREAGLTPSGISLERAAVVDPAAMLPEAMQRSKARLEQMPEYEAYMNNPLWKQRIQDMRDEAAEHFQRHIIPHVNATFINRGAYNTSAREAAQRQAAVEHQNKLDKAINELMLETHTRGLRSAEEARKHYLERATTYAATTSADRSGLMALAAQQQAAAAQAKKDQLAQAALVEQMGAAKQAEEQRKVSEAHHQMQQRMDQPVVGAQTEQALTADYPVGTALSATPYQPAPAPVNPWNVGAGFANTAANLLYRQQNPNMENPPQFAQGGRVKRAAGGPASFESSALYNNPEMQQLRNAGRDQGGDPAWDLVRNIGVEMLKNPTGNPLENYGRGLESGYKSMDARAKQHREQGLWAADRIQKSREAAHEVEQAYLRHSETLGESRRHNMAGENLRLKEIQETIRRNLAGEEFAKLKHADTFGETSRHNRASENLRLKEIEEHIRRNLAGEAFDKLKHTDTFGETSRHNKEVERIQDEELKERSRRQVAMEALKSSPGKLDQASSHLLDEMAKEEKVMDEVEANVEKAFSLIRKDPQNDSRRVLTGSGITQLPESLGGSNTYALSALGHGTREDIDAYKMAIAEIAARLTSLNLGGRAGSTAIAQQLARKPQMWTDPDAAADFLNEIRKAIHARRERNQAVRKGWLKEGKSPVIALNEWELHEREAANLRKAHKEEPHEEAPTAPKKKPGLINDINLDEWEHLTDAALGAIQAGKIPPLTVRKVEEPA